MTESLAHQLRGLEECQVTAHLLVPGFTYTGMISRFIQEKPAAAWMPDQVSEYLLDSMARGDFYILCPDNDVDLETDRRRVEWASADLTENRPALSRWHPEFEAAFAEYVAGPGTESRKDSGS